MVLNLHIKGVYVFSHYINRSYLKKIGKILRYTFLILFLLLVALWLLVQSTLVQNWLVSRVTSQLSKELKTEINVRHVDFALFNKMLIQGLLVKDKNRDTLLYAGEASVRITDWFFLKDKAELQYIGLKEANIQLKRTDSVWNYQFLADYFASPQSKSEGKIQLDLKKLDLQEIHLLKKDGWRGEDMELQLVKLNVDADSISFLNKIAQYPFAPFYRTTILP